MHVQVNCRYSRLKMFLLVSVLVAVALSIMQWLDVFLKFDLLMLAMPDHDKMIMLPAVVMVMIVFFHTLLPGILILEEGLVKGFVYTVVFWFFYAALIHFYSFGLKYYLPLIAPLVGCVVSLIRVIGWQCTFLGQEKDGIKRTFGCFVEPTIADILLQHPEMIKEGGDRKQVTVMFADLRGFTQLCESIDPEHVIAMLRDCFGQLIHIARSYGGTIDKLIGDCMMVVWGNPVPVDHHADKAVESAVEMQAMMAGLKKKWEGKLGVQIKLGIGINSDEVVAGTIGSEEFCDYTVLGAGVNLASNLESVCPGDKIYISEETYRQLSDTSKCRRLEEIRVKNKGGVISAYDVEC